MASATDSPRSEAAPIGFLRRLVRRPGPSAPDRPERDMAIALNRSPLARKIIAFNLIGLLVLITGVLWQNPFRHSLVLQRESGLVSEARLVASVFEAAGVSISTEGAARDLLFGLKLPAAVEVFVFDAEARLVATTLGREPTPSPYDGIGERSTVITDALNRIWEALSEKIDRPARPRPDLGPVEQARTLVDEALRGGIGVQTSADASGGTIFSVAAPIGPGGQTSGVVAVTSAAGEIDRLARSDREQVLRIFVLAVIVSIGLSLVLASTIATPLSDLAAAAEAGRDRTARHVGPGRVRIPDLTARADEIGRLSGSVRGMVSALYDRIDANEQFAADVAHEIKNPLASLSSAVGTLRVAHRDDQRRTLLDVIEHDVRRLDRLVSDISNASRLDSELVREEQQPFDLLKLVGEICGYMADAAEGQGVELTTDLPATPIVVRGLQQRLGQVVVNLLTNALSFCEDGDAIRVWVRRRRDRVLLVVEDTGPGIPEEAVEKIFRRFYSERPQGDFGNNSGLGLAISKQIVEAHGGVIWAENIRPTAHDIMSEPAGARFVVGLPA